IIDEKNKTSHPKILTIRALWDTGATNCIIAPDIVKKLGLKPVTFTNVMHGGGIEENKPVYKINIYLPNSVYIPFINATEGIINGQFDLIIGMDIITLGDFAISNINNQSVVTFRVPSMRETDYVAESKIRITEPIMVDKMPGRNDPCLCGSGKKYKNCCLRKKK
ncbi:unnamed protein product, partial [marine sediment metagenome]